MSYIFKFPDIGEGLTEGTLLEWYYKVGDKVKEGDMLAKVDTDKVVADIPAPVGGTIKELRGKEGDLLLVGNPFVIIDDGSASVAVEKVAAPVEQAVLKPEVQEAAEPEESGPGVVGNIEVARSGNIMPATGEGLDENLPTNASESDKPKISAMARKLAAAAGLDLKVLAKQAGGGRIMKTHVEKALKAAKSGVAQSTSFAPRDTTTEALTQIRKTISAKMSAAKSTIPHATTMEEVEVSDLVNLRASLNQILTPAGQKVSYMPLICKAVAKCLMLHPKMNCKLDLENSQVLYHNFVNLGIAVDTDNGLVVPVIRDADLLPVPDLGAKITEFAAKARNRELTINDLQNGTFTITNYGSIAGIFGTPIINSPEAAILGIGRLQDKPVVKDGQIVAGKILPLSLAVDHRIIDGGDAARFMRDLLDMLANPLTILL
jgi:pyruvate dehydrogenase E2 component (dihydrolipoamide acetyltransferase)